MKQRYTEINFKPDSLVLIEFMNRICDDYTAQGFVLTVRQLYYQLVARAVVENTERSYKRITGLVNDARLAGIMNWDAIEDRTRSFITRSHWTSGSEILKNSASYFHMDMWDSQPVRVFVIVEKEALAGVLEGVCRQLDVPLLAARGYPSGTVLREFAVEMLNPAIYTYGQGVKVIHLGDHDPSGIDMSRDLLERLEMFTGTKNVIDFRRVALNMDQIDEQRPPPNPAKTTDSRFADYRKRYGSESWELDALQPSYLVELVDNEVSRFIDDEAWEARTQEINDVKERIAKVAREFDIE